MLKKIYTAIRPFHFFLLIPFFILHLLNSYYGLLPVNLISRSLFAFVALSVSIFLFAKVLLKENNKTGVFAFVAMGYFFGFGAVKDFLETFPSLTTLTSYRYFLPLIALMLLLLIIYLKTTNRNFNRLNNFLFIAITANLLLEIVLFSKNVITGAEKNNDLGDPNLTIAKNYTPCKGCNEPDIFYIIFDEYASSDCLKKYFNFSNTVLDSYFDQNNFFVSKQSRSNYCFTSFSIASIFEMQYLKIPSDYKQAVARDIGRGEYTIVNNNVIKIFEKQGYTIHNHSIFDFENHPSQLGTYFYNLRGMFIGDETLFGRVKRDIGWNLVKLKSEKESEEAELKKIKKNTELLVTNKNIAFNLAEDAIKNQDPSTKDFFYFHFMLPHDPFIFDSTGTINYYTDYGMRLKEKYISQLKYTNTLLINLVNLIQEKYNKKAVIILQGDHGFKQWPGDPDFQNMAFQNLNAVFLPDTTYKGYYDSVSSVNTFRLLFNHYFKTEFELLPDKTVDVFIKPALKKNYGIRQDNN